MVPPYFDNFFSVMAEVGATLFGLIFVVISIRPDVADTAAGPHNTPMIRQIQVASAYTALLNPVVISLLAIVPQATIGHTTLIMSLIGLAGTLMMGISLVRDSTPWRKKLNGIIFLVGSLLIFSFEVLFAAQLLENPGDRAALDNLSTLLVILYVFGIARAWDLVGARQFHIRDVVTPLVPSKTEDAISTAPEADETEEARQPQG